MTIKFKYSAILVLFTFSILKSICQNNPAASKTAPNIILILADDMGKECIGAYGGTYNTPQIDRLAASGLKFNYGFSQPLCSPSRVQIMTGKYNYKNYEAWGYLNPSQKTFANLAKDAGYVTTIAGKWQLGYEDSLPKHFGFDSYCLWSGQSRYAKPYIQKDGKTLSTTIDDYGPDIFTNYILDFIEKNKNKKFFAYFPMVLVHAPFGATPGSKNWDADKENRNKKDTANFRNMMQYTDMNVGKIISKLKELKLYDNTIIIFTGDNGTAMSILSKQKNGTVVRGAKGNTIDRGVRVPLIVNWGNNKYKVHETDDLVDFSDFLPTLADAMQTKVPKEWDTDGISFFPQLKGDKGTPREWVFSHHNPHLNEYFNKFSARSFRDHRYKLYDDGRFYDLKTDPDEKSSIAANAGSAEAENVRKLFQAKFAKLPSWAPEFSGKQGKAAKARTEELKGKNGKKNKKKQESNENDEE